MSRNNNLSQKPSKVILWGAGELARQYIPYLNEAEIKVEKCVDFKLHGTTLEENIPIISPQEYADDFDSVRAIPVVITEIEEKGEDKFKEHLDYLSTHPQINRKILHPGFIADYIKLNHSGRIYCLGFMGAGNVLLQNILIEILNKYSRIYSPKEQLIGYFAHNYISGLRTVVKDFLIGDELQEPTIGTFQEESCFVQLSGNRYLKYMHLSGIITKNYLYEDMTGSHATISQDFLNILLQRNYTVFLAVRNPLDIIVSFASKYSSPKYVEFLINNLDWFYSAAKIIKEYYKNYCDSFKEIRLIKYEDVIFNSLKTIKGIAEILKVNMTESEVASIWEKVGFKDLGVRHLWRPGAGKWKEYFTKAHIDILKSLEYENFLGDLRYENLMDLDSAKLDKKAQNLNREAEARINLFDYLYSDWYGKSTVFTDKRITHKCYDNPKVNVISNNIQLLTSLDNALKSSKFVNYITALEVNEKK